MKQSDFKIDPSEVNQKALSELLLRREYTKDALAYIPNLARTLNIYKQYKPNLSVLPERSKKTKFTFVELVWIKMVFDLRRFGLDFDIIKELKDFLFKSLEKESIIKEFEKKREELDNMLNNLTPADRETFHRELNKAISSDLNSQLLTHSPLLVIIINSVFKEMPVDFRIYLDGRLELYSDFPDENLIKKIRDPELLNKSFISISLTEIISYYTGMPYINYSLKEVMFSKDELLILETIKKEQPKSITVEFNTDNTIDLIKTKKQKYVDLSQRLSEVFLSKGYEEVTIITENGKVINCTKTKRAKLYKRNFGGRV